MDLKTYCGPRGRQTSLAIEVGAQPQLVWQWANNVKLIPAERCPVIERATNGAVTCEEMRNDIRWHRIADADWPHHGGRPLIDVAAGAPATAGA